MEHAKHLIIIGAGDHGRGTLGPGAVVIRNPAVGEHVLGNPARLVPPPARRSQAS